MASKLFEHYNSYSNQKLLEIIQSPVDTYRPEAIKAARQILISRGIDIRDIPDTTDESPKEPTKQKINFYPFTIIVLALLLLLIFDPFNCMGNRKSKNDIHACNPTDQSISFQIDSKKINLDPGQNKVISLFPGFHELKLNSFDSTVVFEVRERENYLLNPTRSIFYLEEIVYAHVDLLNRWEPHNATLYKEIPFQSIIVDSLLVEGHYKTTDDYIISGWRFGVGVEPPKKLSWVPSKKNLIKVFTESEIYDYLKQEHPGVKRKALFRSYDLIDRGLSNREKKQRTSEFLNWREELLEKDPEAFGIDLNGDQEEPYIALMEIQFNGFFASLVILSDGTTFFFSSQGTYLERKKIEDLKDRRKYTGLKLLSQLNSIRSDLNKTPAPSSPDEGQLQFLLKTNRGFYSGIFPFEQTLDQLDMEQNNIHGWYLYDLGETTFKDLEINKNEAKSKLPF